MYFHTTGNFIPQRRIEKSYGFTLVEMLVVVSVIALLVLLFLPSLSSTKRKTTRINCLSNLRQMDLASQLFSGESDGSAFAGTTNDWDDNINWIYPAYLSSKNILICPNTKNQIRESLKIESNCDSSAIIDLLDNAADRNSYGTSYETFGFMSKGTGRKSVFEICDQNIEVEGVRKTVNSVSSHPRSFKYEGMLEASGPSEIWIFLDGNDSSTSNFPNEEGNHQAFGVNVAFVDGHVEWVDSSSFRLKYEISQDEGSIHMRQSE